MRRPRHAGIPLGAVFAAAFAIRLAALLVAMEAPLGEGEILLDAAGNIAAGRGLCLSDSLLRVPEGAPPILRRTIEQWADAGGVWGVVPPGRPTAFLPPLYPCLLSLLIRCPSGMLLARLLGVMLGSATVAMAYATARRWSTGAAPFVAILAACDPLAAFQSAEISTHHLAAFTVMLPVYLLSIRGAGGLWAWAAGSAAGVAFLVRPTAWMLLPLLALAVRWNPHRVRYAGLVVLSATLVVSPWVVRNALQLGRPLLLTTNGGRNLWEFNNQKLGPEYAWSEPQPSRSLYDPIRQRHGDSLLRPELLPFPSFSSESEVVRNRVLSANFAGFARANPRAYAELVGVRVTQILALWPLHSPKGLRMVFAAHSLPLLVLACVGTWLALRGQGPRLAVGLFVLLFFALHALTAAGFVYRGMIAPFLALLAGDGAAWLGGVARPARASGETP